MDGDLEAGGRMDLMSLKGGDAAQDRRQVVDALLGEAGTSGTGKLRAPRSATFSPFLCLALVLRAG